MVFGIREFQEEETASREQGSGEKWSAYTNGQDYGYKDVQSIWFVIERN